MIEVTALLAKKSLIQLSFRWDEFMLMAKEEKSKRGLKFVCLGRVNGLIHEVGRYDTMSP